MAIQKIVWTGCIPRDLVYTALVFTKHIFLSSHLCKKWKNEGAYHISAINVGIHVHAHALFDMHVMYINFIPGIIIPSVCI